MLIKCDDILSFFRISIQTSPNYPDRYPPSRNCNYVINAPNGKQIQLHVEAFSLEESNGCGFDSLEIR